MAADANSIILLKKQLKNAELKPVYLFCGEERYLMEFYLGKIFEAVPDGGFPDFNRLIIEDAKTPLTEIADFIDTYPMMSEKKVLAIKDSGIFKSANDDIKKFWTEQLSDIPEHLEIVFVETEIDKRSVIYKAVKKYGEIIEFPLLSGADAVTWAERRFAAAKKKIRRENVSYIVEICDEGLSNLSNEIDKLVNFCDEEITRSDIDRLVSKSLNVKVFEMTDAIMEHNADKALSILADMKTVKESAFKILYILFSTFDKLLHAQLMSADGEGGEAIAKKLGVPPFIARKYMKKSFNTRFLESTVIKIAEIDLSIKEGKTDDWTALEQFVAGLFAENVKI